MTRKFLCILALILIIVFSIPLQAQPHKPLKVGFIAAFSGPAQPYGDAARNGFILGLSEIQDPAIQVVYDDDGFVPSKTVTSFNKLVEVDKVELVICVGSATCNAIASLAEAHKVPLIAWASDRHVSLNRNYVIRSYPSGEAEGKRTGEEAVKQKFSKISVIASIHEYPLSWKAGVLGAILPSEVVLTEEVSPSLQDFRSLLLKAKQKGSESFLLCLLPGQVGIFAKQAKQMGMKPKIGGCEFLEDENEIKLANGGLADAWYVAIPVSDGFKTTYKQKYGNENAISGAAVHYDVANLLHMAVTNEKPENIIKSLLEIRQFDGPSGLLTLQSQDGDQFFDYALVAQATKQR